MHVTSQYKGNPNNVSLFLSILLAPAHLGFHEFWKEKKKRKEKSGEKKNPPQDRENCGVLVVRYQW